MMVYFIKIQNVNIFSRNFFRKELSISTEERQKLMLSRPETVSFAN